MKKNTTPITDAITKISITGNVTPVIWYQKIKAKAKKTKHGTISQTSDLLAIAILSDIIYWYRNTEVKDENTGVIVEIKKKFSADKLQKSYQSYADYFGVTKDDVADSINNLVKMGLIEREYRTVSLSGTTHNNIVFLSPIPDAILKLTYTSIDPDPIPQLTPPYTSIDPEAPPQLTGTYTENTTETSFDIYTLTANEKNSIPLYAPATVIPTGPAAYSDRPAPISDSQLAAQVITFLNQPDDISQEFRRQVFEVIGMKCKSLKGKGMTLSETLKYVVEWWATRHFSKNKDRNMDYSGFISAFKNDLNYYESVQPDINSGQKNNNGSKNNNSGGITTREAIMGAVAELIEEDRLKAERFARLRP